MKIISIGLILIASLGFASAQRIEVVDFEGLEPRLHLTADTTYVVNFWATWCKPCIKELPEFDRLAEEYSDEKVKVLLVSLDMSEHLETKLEPFVEKRGVKSEVVLLDDPKANEWIDKVSPDWSGAIPATLIYRGDQREFFEKSFTYEELEKEVIDFLP